MEFVDGAEDGGWVIKSPYGKIIVFIDDNNDSCNYNYPVSIQHMMKDALAQTNIWEKILQTTVGLLAKHKSTLQVFNWKWTKNKPQLSPMEKSMYQYIINENSIQVVPPEMYNKYLGYHHDIHHSTQK